ncbi:MAG: hypothetical protein J6T15_05890 [Bacilli bacterium]|nr:hypothetical protein [Bacilli bacterium]
MEKNKCPYCGAEFFYDYTVCPYCGESLKEDNKQLVSQEAFKSNIDEMPCDDWVEQWKSKQLRENYLISAIYIIYFVAFFAGVSLSILFDGVDSALEIIGVILIGLFTVGGIAIVWREETKKKFAVKIIDGFTILAAKYGRHHFLVCNNKVLDEQKYLTIRGRNRSYALQGSLPNGEKVLAEFYPEIRILELKDKNH